MKDFDVEVLVDAAKTRTGLAQLSHPGIPDIMDNLRAFIDAVNQQGLISDRRWSHASEYFIRLLANRLWLIKDLKEHPEIFEEHLAPPIVILPLPRTGSTKLQRMLGAGKSFQNLLWWHMHMSSRIPDLPNEGVDERIRLTREYEAWMYEVCPDMIKGHPMYAEEPEEEQVFAENIFLSTRMFTSFGAFSFGEWLMKSGPADIYEDMRLQLQYLQWQFDRGSTKPWLLKSPVNIGQEENLVKTFGRDIKMICPHRDPVNSVCSITHVADHLRRVYSDVPSEEMLPLLGEISLAFFSAAATENLHWRESNADVDILDLSYYEVDNDTVGVLRKIYSFLDLELTPAVENSVLGWERDGNRNRFKKNAYSPEEFGLTEERIHEAFAPYLERFSEYI
jgi:hypothetical protein